LPPVASTIQPIFLLADSQLLFWHDEEGHRFLDRARKLIEAPEPKAAYLGASNGDAPEFYDLFVGAIAEIGIRAENCRHVPAEPTADDLAFLDQADLILLAGGDVRQGWEAFQKSGIKEKISQRYYAGAVLLGVSAGAVQLGLKGWDPDASILFDTFCLVPFLIDAHDEPSWAGLLRAVPKAGEHARGLGIPSGGGVLYHPDYSIEPIRHPAAEVDLPENAENGPRLSLLFPGAGEEAQAETTPRILNQEELLDHVFRDLDKPEPAGEIN
jgi:cyanophycinase